MQLFTTIPFDSNNPYWTGDTERDGMFLSVQENYINLVLGQRGYIYHNQICELFGCSWNPDDRNPCIKRNAIGKAPRVHISVLYDPDGLISAADIYCYF